MLALVCLFNNHLLVAIEFRKCFMNSNFFYFFLNSIPSFVNSVDSDQVASDIVI